MPYINQHDRGKFANVLAELQNGAMPSNAGEFNYLITQMMIMIQKDKKNGYQGFNDLLGALEGAKLELYRRAVGPYEDIKAKANGDVY